MLESGMIVMETPDVMSAVKRVNLDKATSLLGVYGKFRGVAARMAHI